MHSVAAEAAVHAALKAKCKYRPDLGGKYYEGADLQTLKSKFMEAAIPFVSPDSAVAPVRYFPRRAYTSLYELGASWSLGVLESWSLGALDFSKMSPKIESQTPKKYESPVLRKAQQAGTISAVTVANYEQRLNVMQRETGRSVAHMLAHPAETYAAITSKTRGAELSTRSYLIAFLAIFGHSKALQAKHPEHYQAFKGFFKEVDAPVQQRYDANRPTARQLETFLPWDEIVKKRGQLDPESIEFLILSLYTMIPPVRADFGNVRVLSREPAEGSVEATRGNYLVVRDKYLRLVLNEFKSKGKQLQQYNKVLPNELDRVIRASLSRQPRSHLLVSPRDQKPFVRDNTYIVFVNRLLQRVLGKPGFSITMLRHSYVNSLDYNELTSGEKCQISTDMLHSAGTNDRYRLKFQ